LYTSVLPLCFGYCYTELLENVVGGSPVALQISSKLYIVFHFHYDPNLNENFGMHVLFLHYFTSRQKHVSFTEENVPFYITVILFTFCKHVVYHFPNA
jgi:hypothetical protein